MKITLNEPIRITPDATPIAELTLRERITASDMRSLKVAALHDPSVDDLLVLAGRLAGQPAAVLNQLALSDLGPVLEAVVDFLVAGRETGKTQ